MAQQSFDTGGHPVWREPAILPFTINGETLTEDTGLTTFVDDWEKGWKNEKSRIHERRENRQQRGTDE